MEWSTGILVHIIRALVAHVKPVFHTDMVEIAMGFLFRLLFLLRQLLLLFLHAQMAIQKVMNVIAENIIRVIMLIGSSTNALLVYIIAPHINNAWNQTLLIV